MTRCTRLERIGGPPRHSPDEQHPALSRHVPPLTGGRYTSRKSILTCPHGCHAPPLPEKPSRRLTTWRPRRSKTSSVHLPLPVNPERDAGRGVERIRIVGQQLRTFAGCLRSKRSTPVIAVPAISKSSRRYAAPLFACVNVHRKATAGPPAGGMVSRISSPLFTRIHVVVLGTSAYVTCCHDAPSGLHSNVMGLVNDAERRAPQRTAIVVPAGIESPLRKVRVGLVAVPEFEAFMFVPPEAPTYCMDPFEVEADHPAPEVGPAGRQRRGRTEGLPVEQCPGGRRPGASEQLLGRSRHCHLVMADARQHRRSPSPWWGSTTFAVCHEVARTCIARQTLRIGLGRRVQIRIANRIGGSAHDDERPPGECKQLGSVHCRAGNTGRHRARRSWYR